MRGAASTVPDAGSLDRVALLDAELAQLVLKALAVHVEQLRRARDVAPCLHEPALYVHPLELATRLLEVLHEGHDKHRRIADHLRRHRCPRGNLRWKVVDRQPLAARE